MNTLADEDDARVRAAYGQNWELLRDVKARYDARNLFRGNANLIPARMSDEAYPRVGTLAGV